MDVKTLAGWITEQCTILPAPDTFALVHASSGEHPMIPGAEMQELICRVKAGQGDTPDKDGEKIAEKIWREATMHADAFGGTQQRYKIAAEKGDLTIASQLFVVGVKQRSTMGDIPGGAGFLPSEPATQAGLLGMLMRHLDNKERTMMESLGSILGTLVATNQTLASRCEKYEESRIDFLEVMEKIGSNKHERDLQLMREGSKIEAREKIVKKLTEDLLPRLVGQFFKDGAPLLGAAGGQETSSSGEKNVAYYQRQLRDTFRVIDQKAVVESLPDDVAPKFFGLLGLGDDPKDVETYKKDFIEVMEKMPREVLDALIGKLTTEHPEKAVVLGELMGDKAAA